MRRSLTFFGLLIGLVLVLGSCELFGFLSPENRVRAFIDDLNTSPANAYTHFSPQSTRQYDELRADGAGFRNRDSFNDYPYTVRSVSASDGGATVTTVVARNSGPEVTWSFKMVQDSFGWLIDDIFINGSPVIQQQY